MRVLTTGKEEKSLVTDAGDLWYCWTEHWVNLPPPPSHMKRKEKDDILKELGLGSRLAA